MGAQPWQWCSDLQWDTGCAQVLSPLASAWDQSWSHHQPAGNTGAFPVSCSGLPLDEIRIAFTASWRERWQPGDEALQRNLQESKLARPQWCWGHVLCLCQRWFCALVRDSSQDLEDTNAMGGWPGFLAESCFIFGLNAFPDWPSVVWLIAGVCVERWFLLSRQCFVTSAPESSIYAWVKLLNFF